MTTKRTILSLGLLLVCEVGLTACAQSQAAQKAHDDALQKGQYKVRLTTNAESVVGTCKFLMMIEPDQDPVAPVPQSQRPQYFRVQAVSKGADTVLVRGDGKVGEAYICGPGPLNPDGTLRSSYDSPPVKPQ